MQFVSLFHIFCNSLCLNGGSAVLCCSQETDEALKLMADKIRQEEKKQITMTTDDDDDDEDEDEDEDEKIFGEQLRNGVACVCSSLRKSSAPAKNGTNCILLKMFSNFSSFIIYSGFVCGIFLSGDSIRDK